MGTDLLGCQFTKVAVRSKMFTQWLRDTFKPVLEMVAKFMVRLGLTADSVTMVGFVLNLAVAAAAAGGHFLIAGLIMGLSSVFDAFDGAVARQTRGASVFGAFLDSVMDRISESAILLGLAWWYMAQPGRAAEILIYVTLVGSLLVSYTRARAEGLGLECKVGLFTRVERCLLLDLALLTGLVPYALWILAIGTLFTVLQRMLHVYRQAGQGLLQSAD